MLRRCFLFVVLLLSGAALRAADAPLILISMDAWRWDYLARYPAETPNLQALAREGVTASGLIPMFPSNTFPNHYSIVTGLTPANHSITHLPFNSFLLLTCTLTLPSVPVAPANNCP